MILLMLNLILLSIAGCGDKEKNSSAAVATEEKQVMETETQTSTEETQSATEENESDVVTKQQADNVQSKYLAVLRNEATFIDTNNDSNTSYMNNIFYGEGVTCTPKQFALVDYDRDGESEVCVQIDLGFDSEFVVLHYFDGEVYGYTFVYRGMEQIGNNGYFIGSNGAAYTDILSLQFDGSEMAESKVAYSDVDSENNPIYLNGDGTQMNEADWTVLLESVQNDTVVWHSFDGGDWDAYFE